MCILNIVTHRLTFNCLSGGRRFSLFNISVVDRTDLVGLILLSDFNFGNVIGGFPSEGTTSMAVKGLTKQKMASSLPMAMRKSFCW